MFSRLLTDLERRQAKTYLKQDGKRNLNIQVLVARSRKYFPQIRADLDLLEKLLETYERKKTKWIKMIYVGELNWVKNTNTLSLVRIAKSKSTS